MADLRINLRYLLWKEGTPREDWGRKLAGWLSCPVQRAEDILEGAWEPVSLSAKELRMLAKVTGLSPANLSEDLIERDGLNILYENIHYLINTLPHGQKKEFAKRLGIDVTTVSRWVSSAHRPAKKKQDEICQYFSLPAGTNLETEAVFLWTDPVSEAQMKTWLIESINFLDVNFLRPIFPALKRLLKR